MPSDIQSEVDFEVYVGNLSEAPVGAVDIESSSPSRRLKVVSKPPRKFPSRPGKPPRESKNDISDQQYKDSIPTMSAKRTSMPKRTPTARHSDEFPDQTIDPIKDESPKHNTHAGKSGCDQISLIEDDDVAVKRTVRPTKSSMVPSIVYGGDHSEPCRRLHV